MRKLITLDEDLHRHHKVLASTLGVSLGTETDAAIRRNLEAKRDLLKAGAKMPRKGGK